ARRRAVPGRNPAAGLLDLRLPDGAGGDVLGEVQRRSPGIPVVVVSGYGSVSDAVEAMRVGAFDFIEKPIALERLYEVVDRVTAPVRPRPEGEGEKVVDGSRYGTVGSCVPMQRVYQLVEMAAPTRCRVLISGARGPGKELISRAITALSPRPPAASSQRNSAAM